jgi:hypothetical protein
MNAEALASNECADKETVPRLGKKSLEDLSVGDWVLLESILINRILGGAWHVTNLVKSRVYLCQYRLHAPTNTRELAETKYVALKSVREVFADEASAQAVSNFARKNGDATEAAIRLAEAEGRKNLKAFIDALPRS